MVKDPPAMQETWVQSLGWEDSLEEGMATHSNIPAWRIPMDREAWRATVHGVTKSGHDWVTKMYSWIPGNMSGACRNEKDICWMNDFLVFYVEAEDLPVFPIPYLWSYFSFCKS